MVQFTKDLFDLALTLDDGLSIGIVDRRLESLENLSPLAWSVLDSPYLLLYSYYLGRPGARGDNNQGQLF
jgi:hypothetical protein